MIRCCLLYTSSNFGDKERTASVDAAVQYDEQQKQFVPVSYTHLGVDVSITGNSTNPTRFQHPVAGTYKKECNEKGKKYFSVASGGGTGRTLHPDNMAAGPASYGMTDTLGRMHSDAQFAGSSSVPAHVEMMGLIGAGNNPMVGMTVAVAVAVQEAADAGKF